MGQTHPLVGIAETNLPLAVDYPRAGELEMPLPVIANLLGKLG